VREVACEFCEAAVRFLAINGSQKEARRV